MTAFRITAAVVAASLLLGRAVPAKDDMQVAQSPPVDQSGSESGKAGDPADKARAELATLKARLDRANAAYSEMRARDYPRGEARAKIVKERDDARRAYDEAVERYGGVVDEESDGD